MSFHITLPSNTPSHIDNTQSDFTTFLSDTIKLDGDYEVALSEINFSTNFYINFGTLTLIHSDFNDKPIIIEVKMFNGTTLYYFVSYLNITINKKLKSLENEISVIDGTAQKIDITKSKLKKIISKFI